MESSIISKHSQLEAGKTDEQNSAIGNVADPISVQALQFFIVLAVYPMKDQTSWIQD